MGSLPPNKFRAPRARRGPSSAVPLLATMLMVVIVLSSFSFVLLDIDAPRPEGPGGDDGVVPPPWGVQVVSADATWRGLDRTLSGPIEVRDGATLTLEGCDITIDLEELVHWRQPFLSVEDGSALELVRSNLTVRMDRNLTDAYYTLNRWDRWDIPVASRVVNLAHAVRPVLSFNVSVRHATTDILVLGQRSAAEPLALLARLPAREGAWEHMEADLSPISGGVGRVAIAPLGLSNDQNDIPPRMYLTDARVLDGGEVPEGDTFPSLDLSQNGWDLSGYDRFFGTSSSYFEPRAPALVYSSGAVRLTGSAIVAPEGMPRRVDALDDEIGDSDRGAMEGSEYDHSRIGAHVEVVRGALEVSGSRVLNVPLRADASRVAINASRLEGDAELVTLRGCTGAMTGCALARRPSPPLAYGGSSPTGFGQWAASVEGDGPFAVRDCDIDGGGMGLYLEGIAATVEGCALSNATRACLWAHDVSGLGGWPRLATTCTFAPAEVVNAWETAYAYIESSTCIVRAVFHNGSEDFEPRLRGVQRYGSELASLPIVGTVGLRLVLRMPAILVLADLVEARPRNLTLDVECYPFDWQHDGIERTVVVGQGEELVILAFDREDLEEAMKPVNYLRDRSVIYLAARPGEGPGELGLNVSVYLYYLEELGLVDVVARLLLDGAAIDELPIDYPDPSMGYVYLCATVAVPPGPHELEVRLLGRHRADVGLEVLCNETRPVLRTNGSTPADAPEAFLDYGRWLLVDPGADLRLDDLPVWGEDSYSMGWFTALLWPGANLTVEALRADAGTWLEVYAEVYGCGNLKVRGWDGPSLVLMTDGTDIEMRDCALGYLHAYPRGGSVSMEGCELAEGLYARCYSGAWLTAVGCTFRSTAPLQSALYVYIENVSLALTDCALVSDAPDRSVITSLNGGRASLHGCTMTNTTLAILTAQPTSSPTEVVLDDCEFTGSLAYLIVAPDAFGTAGGDGLLLRATNLTFAGEGTGAVLTRGLLDAFPRDALAPGAALLALHPFHVGNSSHHQGIFEVLGLGAEPPFEDLFVSTRYNAYATMVLYVLVEGRSDFAYDGGPITIVVRSPPHVLWFIETTVDSEIVDPGMEWQERADEWTYIRSDVEREVRRILDEVDWWSSDD